MPTRLTLSYALALVVLAGVAIYWLNAYPAAVMPGQPLAWIAVFGSYLFASLAILRRVEARLPDNGTFGAAAARLAATIRRRPRKAVCVMAAFATLVATYPIVLFGDSFVSPNVGGVPVLYEGPPFTPGSTDLVSEDPRGTDVSASPWQSVPDSHIERRALANGEIPLWNRFNAAGRPLWGQGLTFLLDPLHWLTILTPDLALGWDLKFVAHRFVFSVGVGWLALAVTGNWVAALLAAAMAPFGGIYSYRFNHPAIFALTYAPWVLLAWCRLLAAHTWRLRVRAASLLAVATALVVVSATPKEALVMLLGLQATGGLALAFTPLPWRERTSRLGAAALAGVTAVLITTPHWLVFFETLALSVTAYDAPNVFFANRSHAVGLFLTPLGGAITPGLHLAALVFVVAAVASPRRAASRPVVLASGLVAAALSAVAFGAVPASIVLETPFIGNIWHIGDTFLTASLPLLLVVVAAGIDAVMVAGPGRIGAITIATGLVMAWLLAGVRALAPPDGFEFPVMLALVPLALALPWCFHDLRRRGGLLPLLAVAAAVAVMVLPGGVHPATGVPWLDRTLIQPRPRSPVDQRSPAIDAVHRATIEPTRTVGIFNTMFAGTQALYDLESIGGADPMEIRRFHDLQEGAGLVVPGWGWLTRVGAERLSQLRGFLDMMNVGFLLARPDEVPGMSEVPFTEPDRLVVGRRDSAWPRAFFVDGVETYDTPQVFLNRLSEHSGPLAAIQSGDAQALSEVGGILVPARSVVRAVNYTMAFNSTSFEVSAPRAGVAVLTETYLPGDFRATRNGRRVRYFRVNHAFKAVAIPSAGTWTVTFEYRPRYWDLSLGLAGAAALCVAGAWLATCRRYPAVASEKPAAAASL